MKTSILMIFLTLIAQPAFASGTPALECEQSAIQWAATIASAPYVADGESVLASDLQVLSGKSLGDGAESYESFVIARKDSNEIYQLTVYRQETNDVCPLEKFEVTRR